MKKALISTLMLGTVIRYREREAVVLDHKDDGVFVQLLDSAGDRNFGKTNDWRNSDLHKYLNGEFARKLTEGNMDELLDTVTDLTAFDGTVDYAHSVDKVTLLTLDQCRKYRYIRPLPDEWEWTSTPHGTPSSPITSNTSFAWYLNTCGNLDIGYCSGTCAARPAPRFHSPLSPPPSLWVWWAVTSPTTRMSSC